MQNIKKDIAFLKEMKSRLIGAIEDIGQYQYLEKMIDDWIDELEATPALPEPMRTEPEPGAQCFIVSMIRNVIICQQYGQSTIIDDFVESAIDACLCYDTEEKAQTVLDWWNEAVGRKA